MQMEEKDLRWNIEVQSWAIRRIANRIKAAETITAVDLVDLAVSCEVLLMELRKHGVEV
jgi:hypothetical protein